MNEIKNRQAKQNLFRALYKVQDANLAAVIRGDGRGNSSERMIEILDGELGYCYLVAVLDQVLKIADKAARSETMMMGCIVEIPGGPSSYSTLRECIEFALRQTNGEIEMGG